MIYCSNYDCVNNREMGSSLKKETLYGFEEYKGCCLKPYIFIRKREIETPLAKYVVPECLSFSNKEFKGHMDWSRFPKGGSVSDDYGGKK